MFELLQISWLASCKFAEHLSLLLIFLYFRGFSDKPNSAFVEWFFFLGVFGVIIRDYNLGFFSSNFDNFVCLGLGSVWLLGKCFGTEREEVIYHLLKTNQKYFIFNFLLGLHLNVQTNIIFFFLAKVTYCTR